jgi:hypothetical protein
VLLVAVILIGPVAGVVAAQDDGEATSRSGGTVVVGPDETVDGDLSIVAGTAIVQGTVNGDLSVVGGDVLVAGTVNGDVDTVAGAVRVTGDVSGSLSGTSGNLFVGEGGQVGGDIDYASGNVVIDGTVGGDATIGAGSIRLGENAVVQGDFEYDADSFDRAAGAQVQGQIVRNSNLVSAPGRILPAGAFSIYGFLTNLLFGALLLLLFPVFTGEVADRVERDPVVSGGLGLLTFVVVPLMLVLLAITIIGIPLSILGALLFALVLWTGFVLGAYAVGDWLVSLADSENRWLALVVGLLAVAVVNLIPILGGLVNFVVLLLGLGAFALGMRRSYRSRRPAPERVERVPPREEGGEEAPGS